MLFFWLLPGILHSHPHFQSNSKDAYFSHKTKRNTQKKQSLGTLPAATAEITLHKKDSKGQSDS